MYKKIKRMIDITFASLAIVMLSPIFLIIAILINRKLGSPVIYRQLRPGLNGKAFRLYKFRSMTDQRDIKGELLPDEKRLPEFGKKLRNTSLDELPEFFNVLKGDMSIIGPRPLLMKYLSLYDDRQKRRHHLRPGITGWAQVNGRNNLSWQEKFEMDVWYTENLSFPLDMKILFKTILIVLKREGITQNGHVTMEEFTGNDNKNR